jgi:hypothetical protein
MKNRATSFRFSTLRNRSIACIAIPFLLLSTGTVTAGEGFILVQTEFRLGKNPGFQRLSLAYRSGIRSTGIYRPGQFQRDAFRIPLYSTDARQPAFFHSLKDSDSGSEESASSGRTTGQKLLGVTVFAVLGATYGARFYRAKRCYVDTDESSCESLGN